MHCSQNMLKIWIPHLTSRQTKETEELKHWWKERTELLVRHQVKYLTLVQKRRKSGAFVQNRIPDFTDNDAGKHYPSTMFSLTSNLHYATLPKCFSSDDRREIFTSRWDKLLKEAVIRQGYYFVTCEEETSEERSYTDTIVSQVKKKGWEGSRLKKCTVCSIKTSQVHAEGKQDLGNWNYVYIQLYLKSPSVSTKVMREQCTCENHWIKLH